MRIDAVFTRAQTPWGWMGSSMGMADNSVESMVLQVASKFGVRAAALPDLTNRARQIFKIVDGELRPVQRDGKSPVLGADEANAISFEEWVTRQVAEAPHLFESSAGGGATGSAPGWRRASSLRLSVV